MFFDPTVSDTAAFGRNQFFKPDLGANGRTDLVVNGRTLFAVTDEGTGKYRVHFIDRSSLMSNHYTLRSVISQRPAPLLVVDSHDVYRHPAQTTTQPDTLVLKFGDFMEYRPVSVPQGGI